MINLVAAVSLMALVTYLPRVIPLVVFRREINSPFLKSFLYYVPYAVLGAMTFPDIFSSTGSLNTAIAGCVVTLFLAYKEQDLIIVAIGAILTVYVTGLLI